jgi:hypothetical protein
MIKSTKGIIDHCRRHKGILDKEEEHSWVLVAHFCNPSYSEGRDQEDYSSKPTQANSSRDHILKKKTITKKGLVEWLKV